MKILFISINGKNDTRTRAFIRILREIGELTCVTKEISEKTPDVESENDIVFQYNSIRDLPKFVNAVVSQAKKLGTIDMLFLDNRMASIPYCFIKERCKFVVQDAREFYTLRDTPHFVGKVGCIVEKMSLKKVDMVICANEQRAKLMKARFNLPETPYVYENIFPSDYNQHFDRNATEMKFGGYFKTDRVVFISSAGCQIERTTDKLVHAMRLFKSEAVLLLVGGASHEDEAQIKAIMHKENIDNVFLIGHVDTNTLKYLMEMSDVGVVIYGKHDENNRYCASGKIYEYLYEKLPMLTCGNEPLAEFCQKTGTGFSTDDYEAGIRELLVNREKYRRCSIDFFNSFDPQANNTMLKNELLRRIKT